MINTNKLNKEEIIFNKLLKHNNIENIFGIYVTDKSISKWPYKGKGIGLNGEMLNIIDNNVLVMGFHLCFRDAIDMNKKISSHFNNYIKPVYKIEEQEFNNWLKILTNETTNNRSTSEV